MKEFMLIFRHPNFNNYQPSAEDLQEEVKAWQSWAGEIAAQVKLVSLHQLGSGGNLVNPGNSVSEGPWPHLTEMVGGNMVVKASSLEEATEMAKGCPILKMGGKVEVRSILMLNN